jgi:O-antigen/teichoic acid export membrane protein
VTAEQYPGDQSEPEDRARTPPEGTDRLVPAPASEEPTPFIAALFGRGLLYVTVSSLPLVTATVVSPILTHVLGPEQFGLLASSIALHQVLMALALFGMDQALVLVRAESGGDRGARIIIGAGTLVAVALTLLVGATVNLWSGLLGFQNETALVLATVSWTVPTALATLGLALLMAQDRLRGFAVVSALLNIGSQASGLAFLVLSAPQESAAVYAWGGTAGRVLAMVACLVLVRPLWSVAQNRPLLLDASRLGLPIMLSSLSTFVLNSADRLIVQSLLGPAEAGRYQVAYTIGFEAITVFAYTGQVWAARFAEVRDDTIRWRLLGRSRDHLYELMAPTLLAINLSAPLLLRIFAPESFQPAGLLGVVFLVSLSGVPMIALLSSGRALITQRRTKPIALAAGLAALVNVAFDFAAIPQFGLPAAALGTAIAFGVQAVVQRFAFRPVNAWPRTTRGAVLALALATAVAAGFVFVEQSVVWIVIRCVLALLAAGWLVIVYRRTRSAA